MIQLFACRFADLLSSKLSVGHNEVLGLHLDVVPDAFRCIIGVPGTQCAHVYMDGKAAASPNTLVNGIGKGVP